MGLGALLNAAWPRRPEVWCRVEGEELVIVGRDPRGLLTAIIRHELSTPGRPSILEEHYPDHPNGRGIRQPRLRPRSDAERDADTARLASANPISQGKVASPYFDLGDGESRDNRTRMGIRPWIDHRRGDWRLWRDGFVLSHIEN